jgi:hypothetical protein
MVRRSRPQAGCIDVGNSVEGGEPLLFAGEEDGRTDASPYFVALSVHRRRIVDLEKERQEAPVQAQ